MTVQPDSFHLLFEDENYVAIEKPSGIFVHPTPLSPQERVTCQSVLRDQLGHWVYPVHRLDRATSGVLIFARSSDAARALAKLWQERSVRKIYHAITRGWIAESGEVDRPLRETDDKERVPARSLFRRLAQVELPDAVGPYASARYSLVEVETLTGRYHQVRKHLLSISHPIVGDTVYGDGDHNRYLRAKFDIFRLLLNAYQVDFIHPLSGEKVLIQSRFPEEFARIFPGLSVV